MLLHGGFESPTPELMAKRKTWLEAGATYGREHWPAAGREFTHDGVGELAWDGESLTGSTIINAESFDAAEVLARSNPFIKSIRIYELADHS